MINLKKTAAFLLAAGLSLTAMAQQTPDFKVKVNTDKEPVHAGAFEPTVESLSAYECPEWFRDAKFGIWAHWGPQCAPEDGDWYARNMYDEKSANYRYQIDVMGHPSEYGFKDWIPRFKAEKWDPDSLIHLYKEAANTGLSVSEYIRICRLKKGAELLSSTKYRINEIAYIVGYSTSSYFSEKFQEQYGVTPSEFRKRIVPKGDSSLDMSIP